MLAEEIDEDGIIHSDGIINFFTESHVSALLCNYSKLCQDAWDKLNDDVILLKDTALID